MTLPMQDISAPQTSRWPAPVVASIYALGLIVFGLPIVLQGSVRDAVQLVDVGWSAAAVVGGGFAALAAALVAGPFLLARLVRRVGNRGLALIGQFAGLHFAVSYVSRLVGVLAGALTGPFYVYVDGVGSKGLACLLLGALVALLPEPGVAAAMMAAVALLNGLFTGLNVSSLLFIATSAALTEATLAACGVTFRRDARSGRSWSVALRVAIALGAANAASMYAQYILFETLYRQFFDQWFKVSVALVTGLMFGGAGAFVGGLWGDRLRRVQP